MTDWKVSEEKCSKCDQLTEILVTTDEEGIEYEEAERCLSCGWLIGF